MTRGTSFARKPCAPLEITPALQKTPGALVAACQRKCRSNGKALNREDRKGGAKGAKNACVAFLAFFAVKKFSRLSGFRKRITGVCLGDTCHSERSEESRALRAVGQRRFLALLGMTIVL
jgi:hypothetical protein